MLAAVQVEKMGLYKATYSTVLARLDPEFCHDAALWALQLGGRSGLVRRLLSSRFAVSDERLAVSALGLRFPNPLGLAAGFDKDGVAVPGLAALGFGFIEVGTVTPDAQPGNPRPRLFRLLEDGALINRMGFPNAGAEALRRNLQRDRRRIRVPIGASLGKGRSTAIDQASGDYIRCLSAIYDHADFFVLNVSSPNTPNLRALHDRTLLNQLLRETTGVRDALSRKAGGAPKPLLVKVAPDLELSQLDAVIDVAIQRGLAGIVATNTTVARTGLTGKWWNEEGGLSGRPLRELSTGMIREIRKLAGNKLLIIGAGGIFSAQDAWEKLTAGATLLQAYTGFIYEGPSFAKRVNQGLLSLMDKHGVRNIAEVTGAE